MSDGSLVVNLKKDSENTPVKGGIMADLGRCTCIIAAGVNMSDCTLDFNLNYLHSFFQMTRRMTSQEG